MFRGKAYAPLLQTRFTHYGSSMELKAFGLSDVGLIRARNEDAYVIRLQDGIFAVADGMGGHVAGNVASRLAIEAVTNAQLPSDLNGLEDSLADLITEANGTLLEHASSNPECAGMGTTLTILAFSNGGAVCGHIGDSRLYQLRGHVLRQISRDHTWVQEEVDRGGLTPEEARDHPYANALTRALGIADTPQPDSFALDVRAGDTFLLCSDGLTKMLEDEEIAIIVNKAPSVDAACAKLIENANRAGGVDNTTVVLVRAS
jgi:serine/threonine protein phosphatase PrpC